MLNATAAMAHSPTSVLAAPGQVQPGNDDGQAFAQALDQAATRQRDAAGDGSEVAVRDGRDRRPEAATRGKAGTVQGPADAAAARAEPLLPHELTDETVVQAQTDEPVEPPPDLAAWAPGLPLPQPAAAPAIAQAATRAQATADAALAATTAADAGGVATARTLDATVGAGGAHHAATANAAAAPPSAVLRQGDARGTRAAPPSLTEAPATGKDTLSPAAALAQALVAPQRPGLDAGAVPLTLPGAWASAPSRPLDNPIPVQAELRAPLGSAEFAPALGSQLSVMVRDGIDHAQLKLNPADMGPIEVRISLDGTQAQVDFSAAHAVTRQALQDALPTLAGALRENGLTLAGGGVFEQTRDQRGDTRQDGSRGTPGGRGSPHSDTSAPMPSAARLPRARGAVDLYA